MEREELLELIPAYALGALDAEERTELEALLAGDAEAQQALAEYRELSEWLTLATPVQAAPAHLQDDMRRRLAARREKRPVRRLNLTLLAAAAVLTLVIAGVILAALTASSDPAQVFQEINASADVQRIALVPAEGSEQVQGELVASPDGTRAVLEVWQLPVLTPDQTYQLWLVDSGGNVQSGGLFNARQPEGATYVLLPLDEPLNEYQAFGVSRERAGGSPYPDRREGPLVFSVPVEEA